MKVLPFTQQDSQLSKALTELAGVLTEFAGNGNAKGVACIVVDNEGKVHTRAISKYKDELSLLGAVATLQITLTAEMAEGWSSDA